MNRSGGQNAGQSNTGRRSRYAEQVMSAGMSEPRQSVIFGKKGNMRSLPGTGDGVKGRYSGIYLL